MIFWTKPTQKWYLQSKSEKVNITTELCIFKLEENSYIFLAGSDALGYLAEPMHKNVPQHLFGATHLVCTYLMTDPKICWTFRGYIEIFQSHIVEKIFQNLHVRLKFNTR